MSLNRYTALRSASRLFILCVSFTLLGWVACPGLRGHARDWIPFGPLHAHASVGMPPSDGTQLPEPIRFGQPVKPNVVPAQHRTSIAFSPDGKKLAWVYHTPDKGANDGGGLMIY